MIENPMLKIFRHGNFFASLICEKFISFVKKYLQEEYKKNERTAF